VCFFSSLSVVFSSPYFLLKISEFSARFGLLGVLEGTVVWVKFLFGIGKLHQLWAAEQAAGDPGRAPWR
jgi:hypothetical protein